MAHISNGVTASLEANLRSSFALKSTCPISRRQLKRDGSIPHGPFWAPLTFR